MCFKGVPLYTFGHGLSYTCVRYSNLQLSAPSATGARTVQVSFGLADTGDRPDSNVAQIYTHQQHSSTYQPIQSLRAFERVDLQPSETKRIQFTCPVSQLAYLRCPGQDFRVEIGVADLNTGSASNGIRLRTPPPQITAVK